MYHIIKDNQLIASSSIWFSWNIDWEIIFKNFTSEEIQKLNSWYLYKDWELIEWPKIKEFEKIKLNNELEQIESDLFQINWRIKWWLELIEMWASDEDDLMEIEEMKIKAQSLALKRLEIKSLIKTLWN